NSQRFFSYIYFLSLQLIVKNVIGKLRHARAHDGFHNIEKETRWRNWPKRVKAHHLNHI
ncbi:hypothetical protein KR067_000154, partial [Drosophila pandora]